MNELSKILSEALNDIAEGIENGESLNKIRIGLTLFDSELGIEELIQGAEIAKKKFRDIEVVLIGQPDLQLEKRFKMYNAETLKEAHSVMEKLLDSKDIDGCVTLHYSFPIGVGTVGKIVTPGLGKEMFIATTTGTADKNKSIAMVKNVISGIAAAKSSGIKCPSVGVLNIDGSSTVVKMLLKLKENGFNINFAESARADGGIAMRGNDLLQGTPDVMLADSLTGNLLMKVFSSYMTGGNYEASGSGYGPGLGEGYCRLINIISRASGSPVVANSIRFCADCFSGNLTKLYADELSAAKKAGLENIVLEHESSYSGSLKSTEIKLETSPPEKITDEEIHGIDILEIENAKTMLWKNGVFAKTGMGCTGPVILISKDDKDKARDFLLKAKYL
jgi:betaine reductase